MKPIIGMKELAVKGYEDNGPFHYRNKAQFPIGLDREEILSAVFMQAELIPLLVWTIVSLALKKMVT